MTLVDDWPPDGDASLVLFPGNRMLVLPYGLYWLRCVARTRAGKRCRNGVDNETGALDWQQAYSARGVVGYRDASRVPASLAQKLLDQHCMVHDSPDVADAEAPEWERFDPGGRHASLVSPLHISCPGNGLGGCPPCRPPENGRHARSGRPTPGIDLPSWGVSRLGVACLSRGRRVGLTSRQGR